MADTAAGSGAPEHVDVVVVGSGFGGAVTAYRLAAGGLRVCLLERGRAYPPGSFARTPHEMQANFWDPSEGLHGLFDVWSFRGTEAVAASGLGGGSLIYANVLLRKDEHWFVKHSPLPGGGYEHWPVSRADLDPHYDAVERMLHGQRYPMDSEPYASTPKTVQLRDAAARLGLDWQLPLLAVTFGNDGEAPVPGAPVRPYAYPDLHGRPRTTCTLCGECDLGCNSGSKNTLDHTYLSAAVAAGADVRTRSEVRRLAPRAGGGYRVAYVRHEPSAEGRRTRTGELPLVELTADRVVLGAGALGTSYLLLKNRGGLPGLSPALGTRFSGNGDLLALLVGARQTDGSPRRLEGSRGPVITSAVRLPDEVDGTGAHGRGAYVEDAGYPAFAAWLAEGVDAPHGLVRAARFLAHRLRSRLTGAVDTGLGSELRALLGSATTSSTTLPLLGMGRDIPDGVLSLRDGQLHVDWTTATSLDYLARLRAAMRDLAGELGARYVDNPLWHLGRRVVTVHALGGAPMGDHPGEGVVDAWGEAFGHPGLYVADGAALPGPVGANPSLTIAAFADRLAEHLLEQAAAARPVVGVVPQRRAPAAEQRPAAPGACRLEFTEEMKGFVTLGESDPRRGHDVGRAQGTALMFHLTIAVEDVDAFVSDPARPGTAVGWVDCDALGGRRAVRAGRFGLFVHDGERGRSRMLYRLPFEDAAGNPVTLTGYKDVHDDAGLDVWRDTSTLYVRLLAGHVEPADDALAPLLGAGIITIHLADFARQLTTFRGSGPGPTGGLHAVEAFGRVFLGELWDTYGEGLLHPSGAP
ncbi:MAG: FAD-dependent oxidoreductase [Frankiales bacterium]|nr:FAD-dependent oxidoreductase [Frankiales bacterium]